MAVILVIGFFGFISDFLVRLAQRKLSWRAETQREAM
jgi:hypothetical protein